MDNHAYPSLLCPAMPSGFISSKGRYKTVQIEPSASPSRHLAAPSARAVIRPPYFIFSPCVPKSKNLSIPSFLGIFKLAFYLGCGLLSFNRSLISLNISRHCLEQVLIMKGCPRHIRLFYVGMDIVLVYPGGRIIRGIHEIVRP